MIKVLCIIPRLLSWLVRVTDWPEATKAARSAWDAPPGASNEEILWGAVEVGHFSRRQARQIAQDHPAQAQDAPA